MFAEFNASRVPSRFCKGVGVDDDDASEVMVRSLSDGHESSLNGGATGIVALKPPSVYDV
jgi:hypothetical protein